MQPNPRVKPRPTPGTSPAPRLLWITPRERNGGARFEETGVAGFLTMGGRIYRSCSSPSCPHPGTVRGRCPAHASEAEAERNRGREVELKVYRSARWRRLRARILRARPWCEDPGGCFEQATDVDHVVSIERGGDPWDEGNLRPLCHPHHSRKTQAVDRVRGKGGRDREGFGGADRRGVGRARPGVEPPKVGARVLRFRE